jgi:multiple sugar transport system permease protein
MLIYPLLFMVVSAFRGKADFADMSIVWITRNWTLDNIFVVVERIHYFKALLYSFSISLPSAILQALVCSFVGYGFARFNFPLKKFWFSIVIFSIIVPPQTYIIPLFIEFRFFSIPVISNLLGLFNNNLSVMNLIDTPFPFIIQSLVGMGFRSGLFIYIFRQYYRSLPRELDDSALIDGCGFTQTFFKIMMPNAIPGMITVLMFSFVWHYNDYFVSSILSTTKLTLAVSLAMLRGTLERFLSEAGTGTDIMMYVQVLVQAGALIVVAPLLLLFSVGQKYFTEGIERTGIVG